MISRRAFHKLIPISFLVALVKKCPPSSKVSSNKIGPKVISTWLNFNANKVAIEELTKGSGSLLNAVEKGINFVESDPNDRSVGYGGRPDRDGHVTLDACIMDHKGQAGSVTFLEGFRHAISVARRVMEKTPHVILSGKGAALFAEDQGFKRESLLTEISEKEHKEWLLKAEYQPVINIERHDTIGMLAVNQSNIVGGCSTSGQAYKMHGRVGDSPVIGAGLYVDNKVGGAVATGLGELVLRKLSSFLVVELMKNGMAPNEACKTAIQRIVDDLEDKDAQVAILAMDKAGRVGAYSIHPGFVYVISDAEKSIEKESESYFRKS